MHPTQSAHEINWYNDEKTAILWETRDLVNWSTFYQYLEEMYAMLDTVDHPVDIIYVMRNRQFKFPRNIIANIRKIAARIHRNERWKIIVGSPPYIRSMFTIACNSYPHLAAEWVFVDTLDDADSFLGHTDNAVQLPHYPATLWN